MIKRLFSILITVASFSASYACTNFLVGKSASADGSTYISYNADSYYLFGALYHYPAAIYPKGTMLKVYEWDTGKYLGKIPQAEQTYNVIGNINEFQVSIGETTYGGREELVDTTAIMDYGSLIYIALQRSKTAREAIKIMTDLVEKYGYYSEGESFSIADPNEVWIMEMIGKGPGRKGAVWVALRIPDDCVSAHANQARITNIPFKDKKNCMYSKDVVSFAREKGYFSGKDAEFSFSDTYAPLDYSALRICEARVWTFFRQINPEMDKFITYVKGETKERMPLWIKPDKKVSLEDLKRGMRDMFEGTEFDMTKGVAAGPFGSKLRHSPLTFKVDGVDYGHERPIATQQTGFTFVSQMRSWLPNYIGGIMWFGVDDAASTVYMPIYCSTNKVPWCLDEKNGSLLDYSATSSFWVFNYVANFAYGKYLPMMEDIRKKQQEIEASFAKEVPEVDKKALSMNEIDARAFLTDYSNKVAENTTTEWKKLGEFLLVKFMDGNIKKEENGKFLKNKYGLPPGIIRAGYPEFFQREMIKENPDLRQKTKEELENRK
ncbi:Peptidase U34 dipeptidase [uncultured Paludibacter sp.]|uniref:Dipeptidase n=1 Tax=uncultured Paludibacter sp. TaxID=497635 RepID=A0A653AHN7_9BACT|nr:Peptidase U34 dipeptidase [uncultured Paludibacter sp.]